MDTRETDRHNQLQLWLHSVFTLCCTATEHRLTSHLSVMRASFTVHIKSIGVSAAPSPLRVTTLNKLFTHLCLCSPSSINWYRRKLGAKQALHAIHWPRVRGLAASAGVRLAIRKMCGSSWVSIYVSCVLPLGMQIVSRDMRCVLAACLTAGSKLI